jgi:hypothetical protein
MVKTRHGLQNRDIDKWTVLNHILRNGHYGFGLYLFGCG